MRSMASSDGGFVREIGRQIARSDEAQRHEYDWVLPDWTAADVPGSPFSIARYVPDPRMGGWPGLDRAHAELNTRGMKLIAYEGGQHLVGILGVENNQAVTDLFAAANREARMGAAYTQYLQSWKDNGGELFVHFTLTFGFGRFGSWGALESLTQAPDPPKQQAIEDFMQANPCWWNGCEQ